MEHSKNISVPPTEFYLNSEEVDGLLKLDETKNVIQVLGEQGIQGLVLFELYRLVHFPS